MILILEVICIGFGAYLMARYSNPELDRTAWYWLVFLLFSLSVLIREVTKENYGIWSVALLWIAVFGIQGMVGEILRRHHKILL